jgi:hypothetical protein
MPSGYIGFRYIVKRDSADPAQGLSQPAVLPVEELSRSELRVLRYLPMSVGRT